MFEEVLKIKIYKAFIINKLLIKSAFKKIIQKKNLKNPNISHDKIALVQIDIFLYYKNKIKRKVLKVELWIFSFYSFLN